MRDLFVFLGLLGVALLIRAFSGIIAHPAFVRWAVRMM